MQGIFHYSKEEWLAPADGLEVDQNDDGGADEPPQKRRRTVLPSSRQVHVLPIVEEVKMETKEEVKTEAGIDIKEEFKEEEEERIFKVELKNEYTEEEVEVEVKKEVKGEVKMAVKEINEHVDKKHFEVALREEVAEDLAKNDEKDLADKNVGQFEESKVVNKRKVVEEQVQLNASSSGSLLLTTSFEIPLGAELEPELRAELELGVELGVGAEIELGVDGDEVEPNGLFRPYLI